MGWNAAGGLIRQPPLTSSANPLQTDNEFECLARAYYITITSKYLYILILKYSE